MDENTELTETIRGLRAQLQSELTHRLEAERALRSAQITLGETALVLMLGVISEEYWGADWYDGVEYVVWGALQEDINYLHLPPATRAQLERIRAAISGWVHWDNTRGGAVFITRAAWEPLYQAWCQDGRVRA